jgi:integrase
MQRTLVRLLAHHTAGDMVHASDVHAVASDHGTNIDHTLEILRTMEIVADDRPATFDAWLEAKLVGLAPAIARETGRWARHLHDGGPRNRPRSPNTAATYLRRVRPALANWSTRYDHLREVTHDDVSACVGALRGEARRGTVTALRSLFRWARRSGVVFRNPATGIRLGKRDHPVLQPLTRTDLAAAVAAATTPQARVVVALAAIHAARPFQIRALQLDDVDLASRRLSVAGHERPLDDPTYHVLREWLTHRAHRWPHTANPHLLVSRESALGHDPVSHAFVLNLRGLAATAERLRIDRQLEEALAVGFDPLHLARVFGIAETTAIRYATNARQLLTDGHAAIGPSSAATRVST